MKITLISTDNCIVAHGLRIISSCLKLKGNDVKLIFLPLSNENDNSDYQPSLLSNIVELLADSDLIGISSMAASSHRAAQLAQYIKKSLSVPLLWGGIHATLSPEECLQFADIVCIGEGEEALVELVEKFKNKNDYFHTRNFWFKMNGKLIKNELRPLKENLDEFPFPDYELKDHYILKGKNIIPAQEYLESNPAQIHHGYILVHTTRGCPNSCAFCSNSFLNDLYKGKGNIIRKRSLDKVIEELIQLRNLFPLASSVWISDDTFFSKNIEELESFSQKYNSKIGIPFQCFGNPSNIREDKLKILLKGGLRQVIMGIQTGSESFNRDVYKRFTSNESVLKAAHVLNRYKDDMEYPIYQIIISNPYETSVNLIETIELLQILPKPYFLEIFNLIFFPGCELYKRALNDNLITDRWESKFNLDYCDDKQHLRLEKKNVYLNTLIYCMRGNALSSMIGIMPTSLIDFFVKKKDSKYVYFYWLLLLCIWRFREATAKILTLFPKNLKIVISKIIKGFFIYVSNISILESKKNKI